MRGSVAEMAHAPTLPIYRHQIRPELLKDTDTKFWKLDRSSNRKLEIALWDVAVPNVAETVTQLNFTLNYSFWTFQTFPVPSTMYLPVIYSHLTLNIDMPGVLKIETQPINRIYLIWNCIADQAAGILTY